MEGGIMVVDDWGHPEWLGVRNGIFKYFWARDDDGPRLVPFLAAYNKLYLTTPSHHEFYFDAVEKTSLANYLIYTPLRTELDGVKVWSDVPGRRPEIDPLPLWEALIVNGTM
ncbi:hypothetical protein HK104_002863 [Borealophlyctis nickersoniae]|nr:hypothetical protein HK104_002863 [Borealophlyctis nickersoniae]